MDRAVCINTARKFRIRQARPGLDQNPARDEISFLSHGSETENEDRQHRTYAQPSRTRRSHVRRARAAVKWCCLPSYVHYAGLSPSFAKLAMCQHLKVC